MNDNLEYNNMSRENEMNTSNEEIFRDYKKELDARMLYNDAAYDRYIIYLSAAFLVIPLIFYDSYFSLEGSSNILLIGICFGLFLASIVMTILSFYVSNKAIATQLSIAEDYYINNVNVYEGKNIWNEYLTCLKVMCGVSFISGITLLFVLLLVIIN